MSLSEALATFVAISGFIWLSFERIEKLSSKSQLDDMYLLLTVERGTLSGRWRYVVVGFLETAFNFRRIGALSLPSPLRIAILSAVLPIIYLLFFSDFVPSVLSLLKGGWIEYSKRTVPGQLFLTLVLFSCGFVCDYVNLSKANWVLQFILRSKQVVIIVALFFLDYCLSMVVIILTAFFFQFLMTFFLSSHPEMTARFLFIQPVFKADGTPNWDETFYEARLVGNPYLVVLAFINAFTGIMSTVIIVAFAVSTLIMFVIDKIGPAQKWLDRHTAIQEKPFQVLGAIVILGFTPLFWVFYTFFDLIGVHIHVLPVLKLWMPVFWLF